MKIKLSRHAGSNFTAIDFETAQSKHWSICQVGLVRIENGVITDKIIKLVCPPDNHYSPINIGIHGITPDDTCDAPSFTVIWSEIKKYILNQTVVAHNGAFDFSCLSKTLDYYGLAQPKYKPQCTYKIFRKKLDLLCEKHKIPLNHHDALSDAMACAKLYQLHLGFK